jgi:P-type Cu+ transporter
MVKTTHDGHDGSGRGTPKVVSVVTLDGRGEPALLALAARLARGLDAPLAAAILDSASERDVHATGVDGLDQATGAGVAARIAGRRVVLGDSTFFKELGLSFESLGDGPEGG